MKIIIIGAIGKNNELGKNNKLLWNLKKDLEFFKNITLNHTVVMGYNTYKSLPKKLENRKMIVLTSKNIKDKDIITYKNEYELLKNHANEDLYIIGGAQVYKTFLEYADELYLTQIEDVKEALLTCAKCGVNAITTCEEAFYPMNSNPNLTKEIDELAKKNNCTITGSGYQDAYWGNLIATIVGSSHKITKIKGSSSYNVEDYGIALAKAHGAGLTKEEFEKQVASADEISDEERQKVIESGNYAPSYMWNVNGWLCDKLGLTVVSQRQKCVPQFNDYDIESSTLGMTVKTGMATGMSAVVTTETKEGITLETECIGKVYNKDEVDRNAWTICGEQDTTMVIEKPDTVRLTCATVVNRIPDVIAAPAGFVPTSRMGELKYVK